MAPDREQTVAELGQVLWDYAQQAYRLQAAIGERLGLHATDLACLAVLSSTPRPTAGDLAGQLGLTTGAVTRMVDRLAERGYVRRSADLTDRRRVLIELTAKAVAEVGPAYYTITADLERAAAQCTDEQLCFLLSFVRDRATDCVAEAARMRSGQPAARAHRSRVIATSTP
ncbi:MarR family transcriptional regulator [Solwaraspora sp. WMMD406]|uniref:MarR family winged helix-turn-helix transcriptional regulator n=1 Tax=Solwaraspora sp. WMMD406 TaxID=3016095 RepID=UPI00241682E5|nr:MarR family transcriptional regulator [Solwaraspora sp. WMMD406]MDG4767874.1 MarR family transcriptional regulator [Solwaraspora sp. WMMD406]